MLYLLIAAAVVAGDQWFKFWIIENIKNAEGVTSLPLIPGILQLTYAENTGASFSMLKDQPWLITAITAVAIVLIAVYMFRAKLSVGAKVSLAAVLGGAIGNLVDRFRLGYVVDMFETLFMRFAIFNIADCFIVCGGIVFCIFYIREAVRAEQALKPRPMPELERLRQSQPAPKADAPASQEETDIEN